MKWLLTKSLKIVALALARLPVSARDRLGSALGLVWFDVLRIRRKVALENLRLAFPQWDEARRIRCARRSVQMLLINLLDYSLFLKFERKDVERYFDIVGLEHWEHAQKENKGVLILSLHLGRADLGVAALSRMGLPLHLISKEFKSDWLNKIWFGIRARHGTRFISFHKSLFEILRALKERSGIVFVLDQFMGPPSGVPVTFFGHPTGTAKGLAMIAERTGAPVVPVHTHLLDNGRNLIVFEPPIEFSEQGQKELNIRHMTQIYTDKIQEIVQKYPEQWMWIHKRWKNFA